MTNLAHNSEVCIQDAYALTNINEYLHRRRLVYIGTATQDNPWEWVDPPMALGVEYRTTERYMGKPVYAKLLNLGSMPSSGSYKEVQIPYDGDTNYIKYARICENHITYWGLTMPVYNSALDLQYAIATNSSGLISLNAKTGATDLSQTGEVIALVKYTKTTD